jgi:hypothetical protein
MESRAGSAIVVGMLAAILAFTGASCLIGGGAPAAPSPQAHDILSVRSQGSPTETPVCATIATNVSLNRTYSYAYNASQSGGGNFSSTNQSGSYPNLTVGDQQLHSAWVSICESPQFSTLYVQFGAQALTKNLEPNASSGHYQASFTFLYLASCNTPTNFSSSGCEYLTAWYVDLFSGQMNGPITSSGGTPGGTGNTGGTPGGSNPGGTPSSHRAVPLWYTFALIGALVGALVVAVVAVTVRSRSKRTDPDDDELQSALIGITPAASGAVAAVRRAEPNGGSSTAEAIEPVASDPLQDVY